MVFSDMEHCVWRHVIRNLYVRHKADFHCLGCLASGAALTMMAPTHSQSCHSHTLTPTLIGRIGSISKKHRECVGKLYCSLDIPWSHRLDIIGCSAFPSNSEQTDLNVSLPVPRAGAEGLAVLCRTVNPF